jgi:hypothetical protein
MNGHKTSKSGSALLLTLLVVSLLLVIVLSFTVYVRLELRSIGNQQNLMLARHNAKLAMNLALAQLQKAAGPDQRVTARAEILGAGVGGGNNFWTGVWDATDASFAPEWLVSGNNPDPQVNVGANAFTIFSATDTAADIRVPTVNIQNQGNPTGEYAYWVADEGVKASALPRRQAIPLMESASFSSERRFWEFQTDFGSDLFSYFPSANISLDDTVLPTILERMSTLGDFSFIKDSANNPFTTSPETLKNLSHDLTPLSYGVLENPVDGGLKTNLSDPAFIDGFLATSETHNFLSDKTPELSVEAGLPGIADENLPYFSPRPLLSEVVLYMGIFHTWSDAKIRIRYHIAAEFINPYSLPLVFPADLNGSYDRGVTLVFENMPTITVEDKSGIGPTITQDLNNLSAYSVNDSRRYINTWVEIDTAGTPNIPTLNPGEVYQVLEPEPVSQPRGLARDFGTTTWSTSGGTKPANTAEISIKAVHPVGGITIKMVPYQNSGNPRDFDPIMVYEGLEFDDFEITKIFNSGPNPFSRATSSSYLRQDYIIAYHFRLKSDATDPQSMKDLLTSVELRDPDFQAKESFVDLNGVSKLKSEVLDPVDSDPSVIIQDDANLFSQLDQIMDPSSRDHQLDYNPTLLYDIPVKSPLSIGQLSSLHVYKQAPRRIGSPQGGNYNRAFDRYFLSPKVQHPIDNTTVLLNPALGRKLEPYQNSRDEHAPYQDDAELELVQGQFNLNSTSVKAWEAVLAAPILRPAALDEVDVGGNPLSGDLASAGTFFRLPQFQSTTDHYYVTKTELQKPENLFAQGMRSLDGSSGRTQLQEIATNIVQALKNRGEPFPTMESFINAGILQDAIDAVPAINEDLMAYANSYLTQQDLLTKIAPTASLRSDTFKIRGYGTANAANDSFAVCEAVVYRVPQKIDGSDPLSPATSVLNAREFEILSFRWLTNEEL